MRNLIIILLMLMTIPVQAAINLTTQVEQFKIVNGDAGLELTAKIDARFRKFIPIIYKNDILTKIYYGAYIGLGVSQQYTAPRLNKFAYNHYGDRMDWSLGVVFEGAEAIYTHSVRRKYAGANPDVLFFNKDVDSFKVRWKNEF